MELNDTTVHPGETLSSDSILVSVVSRRKLGKLLTIAHCTIISASEHIDVVARGPSLIPFSAPPTESTHHTLSSFIIEANRSKPGRRVFRVLSYGGATTNNATNNDDGKLLDGSEPKISGHTRSKARSTTSLDSPLPPKSTRAQALSTFLKIHFPPHALTHVIDVAGGRGDVSAALIRTGQAATATCVEPVARVSHDDSDAKADDAKAADATHSRVVDDEATRAVKHINAYVNFPKNCPEVEKALETATIIVAMHPDEATEAAVCLAASKRIPFAVVPCCVFPSLFARRRQFWLFDPRERRKQVNTHATFVEYLVRRARKLGVEAKVGEMALQGKNTVVYWAGEELDPLSLSRVCLDGPCIQSVTEFLDVESVWRLGPVSKDWCFYARRALREGRVANIVGAIRDAWGSVEMVERGAPGSGRRVANVKELMREDFGWCSPRLKGLLAILHGTVKGGAYIEADGVYLQRAGVKAKWADPAA